MKKILILGAGTAGTMMANHLSKTIDHKNWSITIIDQDNKHYYQPGFLFVPFGFYTEKHVVKTKSQFIPKKVNFIQQSIEQIKPDTNQVVLTNQETLDYDILILATGTDIAPDEIDGMLEDGWQKSIFDFYTWKGASALAEKLKTWNGGKFVINIAEMPIKCPVAPLEFAFWADYFFTKKGIRNKVDITYVTPLSGAFTKPIAADMLGHLLEAKNISLVTDYHIGEVDNEKKQILSYDDKPVDYDLLMTIPPNMGNELIERSDMGDELNFVPTHQNTLQSKAHDNIFVIGDATDLPSSKAGSVAHFQAEILTENIMNFINDKPLAPDFDGHANCFVESGFGKAILIDFNYDVQPLPGTFPVPLVGPFKLLKESYINHFGKLAFKWMYWNMLLKGIPIPTITAKMSKKGKKFPK